MYSEIHRERTSHFHTAPAKVLAYNCAQEKPTLVIRNTHELQDAIAKYSCHGESHIHIMIEESEEDEEEDLLSLYNITKLFHPGTLGLENLTISYNAQNADDSQNPVRLMILVNLLGQIDWDVCKFVDINLNVNYLEDDRRLLLIEDLPVIVRIHGKMLVPQHSVDRSKLEAVADSYSYLKDYI